MKYNIIILIVLISVFQSCENKDAKRAIELIKIRKDSIELVNKIKKDSIEKIEEKIAIGNINFGINKDEYYLKFVEFIDLTNGKLGEYEFIMSASFDDDGGLEYVWLNGKKIHYDYYKRDLFKQFLSLKEILVKKYGTPTAIDLKDFPNWTEFDKGESKNIYYWKIGNKSIFVSVVFPDEKPAIYFQLNVSFGYNTPEKLDKSIKETEQKEKESIEKAVKSL